MINSWVFEFFVVYMANFLGVLSIWQAFSGGLAVAWLCF